MKTYPINLVLQDRLVILVGAKGEIVHKIAGLLDVGAHVRVIAPSAAPEVAGVRRQRGDRVAAPPLSARRPARRGGRLCRNQ
jgi:siroheme synthase (precorrin-2 oxidase/ferrochelatase)